MIRDSKTLRRFLRVVGLWKLAKTVWRYKLAMSFYSRQLNFLMRWCFRDTENSNFYYDLTDLNLEHLKHLIASITGESIAVIKGYIDEIRRDSFLKTHIEEQLKSADYPKDIQVAFGRRIGWYVFVRVLKPKVVVETGVYHGVGACILTRALMKNAEDGGGEILWHRAQPQCGPFACWAFGKVWEDSLWGFSKES